MKLSGREREKPHGEDVAIKKMPCFESKYRSRLLDDPKSDADLGFDD
jgi:hypothetical protein